MNQPDSISITATEEEWKDFQTCAKIGMLAYQTIEKVRSVLHADEPNAANYHAMAAKIHVELMKADLERGRSATERKPAA